MSDWWAKKLGNPPPQQERTPPAVVPAVYAPTKATSAKQSDDCPECGSGNYFSQGEAKKQCFDCGYPVRQSGSGVSGGAVSGIPVKAARQVESPTYIPNQIVGRLQ